MPPFFAGCKESWSFWEIVVYLQKIIVMPERNQILTYLVQNKGYFLQKYHLVKLGVFGSYARGEQTKGSDLDLIVEFEENTPNLSEIKNELRSEVQATLRIPVDVCREKYIKPFFRQQILAEAQYV